MNNGQREGGTKEDNGEYMIKYVIRIYENTTLKFSILKN